MRALAIEGAEGETATMSLTIERPAAGLLSGDRFAHLSVLDDDGAVHHLFAGRRLGVPSDLFEAFAVVEYDCRTGDIDSAIETAISPLRVAPGYDELLLAPGSSADPFEVLDGYHAELYIDRRDQSVAVSDNVIGRAHSTTSVTIGSTTVQFDLDDDLAWSTGVRLRASRQGDFTVHVTGPVTAHSSDSVTIEPDASNGAGTFTDWMLSIDLQATDIEGESLTYSIVHEPITEVEILATARFTQQAAGEIDLSTRVKTALAEPNVRTFSLEREFVDYWPREGEQINGQSGYTVTESKLARQNPSQYLAVNMSYGVQALMPRYTYSPTFKLAYDYEQRRTETLTLTLQGDAQAVPSVTARKERVEIYLQSVPVDKTAAASFFLTARGEQVVAHMLHAGAVLLAESQRCVEITCRVPGWPTSALYVDCDRTVSINHAKLPGGVAIGKVVRYSLVKDERSYFLELAVRCSVGNGYAGDSYAAPSGYVESEYNEGYAGEGGILTSTGAAGEIPALTFNAYSTQQPTVGQTNIANLAPADFAGSLSFANLHSTQEDWLTDHAWLGPKQGQDNTTPLNPRGNVSLVPSNMVLELLDLSATDDAEHAISVTGSTSFARLKTIDLSAT